MPRIVTVPRRPPTLLDARGNPVVVVRSSAAYEGGSTTPRLAALQASDLGINSALIPNLATMRGRVRALRRSSPLIQKGLRAAVADLVGAGPTPRPKTEDRALRKPIKQLWEDWARQVGFLKKLIVSVKVWAVTGEALARFRPRLPKDGLVVPLDLQVLAPDHLPLDKTERLPNGRIIAGVQFDLLDRIDGYWLYPEHPGEALQTGNFPGLPVFVRAEDVLHLFEPEEPGQVRGEPMLAAGIVRAHKLDVHDDAQIERQLVAALYTGWFTSPDSPPVVPGEGGEDEPDEDGTLNVTWKPGMIGVAPDGLTFTESKPPQLANEYEAFQKKNQREVAGTSRVTYEQLTGDYQGVTFSSVRASLIQQDREGGQTFWSTFEPWCQAVYTRVIKEAVFAGKLDIRPSDFVANPLAYTRCTWIPDGRPWVDPESEANAWVTLKENGLASRQGIAASRGWDIEDIDEERFEDAQRELEIAELEAKIRELRSGGTPAAARRTRAERQAAEVRRG